MSHVPPSSLPLRGRVIAVTGASRGIGAALVDALARAGASVLAGARGAFEAGHPAVRAIALDVTSEASVAAYARTAIELGAEALVNNAGVGSFAAIEDATVDEYRRIFDTNVLGTVLVCRALVPHFKARHARGLTSRVVNVTSDVSSRTFAGGALYTGSKFAQRAVTRALAFEGERYGVSVTEVRPGQTDTHFDGHTPGSAERSAHLQPADVAQAVLYALAAPPHVRIDEITLHPVVQPVAYG